MSPNPSDLKKLILPEIRVDRMTSELWAHKVKRRSSSWATPVLTCSYLNVNYDRLLLQSSRIGMDTGNRFRSCVLGVMSPARFLCAMPVKCCSCLVSLELWQTASAKQPNWNGCRQQASILWPSAYEAIIISLSDLCKSNEWPTTF